MGLAIAAAAAAALLLLRAGAYVSYAPGELTVRVSVGFMKITVFPRRVKTRKTGGKERARTKKRPAKPEERAPRDLRELLRNVLRVLAKLRRRVLVKRLCVHYVRGGEGDAFRAAMTYGGLSAAFGLAAGTLESALRVKRYDLRESVDFLADESKIYIDAAASLAVWEIISLAITALPLLTRSQKPKARDSAVPNAKRRTRSDKIRGELNQTK